MLACARGQPAMRAQASQAGFRGRTNHPGLLGGGRLQRKRSLHSKANYKETSRKTRA
jgi:hypothetical protein